MVRRASPISLSTCRSLRRFDSSYYPDSCIDWLDEEADGVKNVAEQEEYPVGESRTLTTTLDAGKYVLICNIAGHCQLGMYTAFTVTGSEG